MPQSCKAAVIYIKLSSYAATFTSNIYIYIYI